MNQSIRATEPAQIISLKIRTDCVIFDPENRQIILTYDNYLSYYDQDTLEFQYEFPLKKCYFLLNLQFQPCTHNLLLYDSTHRIHVYMDEKKPLAIIKNIGKRESYSTRGLCCLPNGDICAVSKFYDQMKIFDSSGRFLSAFGSDGPMCSRGYS